MNVFKHSKHHIRSKINNFLLLGPTIESDHKLNTMKNHDFPMIFWQFYGKNLSKNEFLCNLVGTFCRRNSFSRFKNELSSEFGRKIVFFSLRRKFSIPCPSYQIHDFLRVLCQKHPQTGFFGVLVCIFGRRICFSKVSERFELEISSIIGCFALKRKFSRPCPSSKNSWFFAIAMSQTYPNWFLLPSKMYFRP